MKKWIIALCLFSMLLNPRAHADEKSDQKVINALLITGGCCHDYSLQAKLLVEGSQKQANIKWTIMHDPRKGTQGKIDLYNNPNWAKPFDVVVHNECFAATSDPEYIRKVTKAHAAGVPAVVIHCAMHTYRSAKINDWREFLGVSSFHHEHQSNYLVTPVLKDHPIMKGFPKDWKTPKDELYIVSQIWPKTKVLATSKSERNGKVQPVFWVSEYGKAKVFGTTYGHSNETWGDKVFIDTLVKGMLWSCNKLTPEGKVKEGYEPKGKSEKPKILSADWTNDQLLKLPKSEKPVRLFTGRNLNGWEGDKKFWKLEDGYIVGRNEDKVPSSTYLFTKKKYRNFRLLLETKQTRSPKHSTMHSAICVLGEQFEDKGNNKFGFKGPLLMCSNDWGIWDAYRRNRIEPAGHSGTFNPKGVERVGQWNSIEILVIGNRIRFVANGQLVFDFTDKPEMLQASPIGLQLHSNNKPQEHMFRGLILSENPEDKLITLSGQKQ